MEEDDGLAVGANLRLIANGADVGRLALRDALLDALHFDANVVEAAVRVLVQEGLNGALLAEGVEELELRVGELHKNGGDAVLGEVLRGGHLRGEEGLVHVGGLVDALGLGDGDGDVVEAAEAEGVGGGGGRAADNGAEHC